mgnify:CR=1 FL=1
MADNNTEIKASTVDDGSGKYEMKVGLGTIAMLISATGMGLVPLFSRWATRTDMFDGALGLNAGDSIGALMAVGRMSMGVLFFVVIMFATGKVETFKKLKLTPAIALGGLMIGMSLACYVTSTLLTTISNAVLFIYIGPVVCVVLARIFRNLTANALRHGAAAPVIEQRGGRVTFENRVDDPDAIDVDRLFERFYQGGGARSSAGAGLGLAIVSQLAAALGATVAASLEGDVLRVTVELQ